MKSAYIVSKQELDWLLGSLNQLLGDEASMSYYGSLYFVGTNKSDGVMAAPAEANAANALWLVLLVHVYQQAVQL